MGEIMVEALCHDCEVEYDEADDCENCKVCKNDICDSCKEDHAIKHCFEGNT